MTRSKKNQTKERRTEPRTPCSENIFFATKSQLYEGLLKDYSRNGVFIRTYEDLPVGEMITVALPYLDATADKCKGQVMWSNKDGFGVELFRKRDGAAQMYFKSEIKLNKQSARTMTYN